MMTDELPSRLAAARRVAGLSQRAIATILGVSQAAYAGWEMGRREPRLDVLAELAQILNVPPAQLIGGGDAEPTALVARLTLAQVRAVQAVIDAMRSPVG
ncbi:helix-turn-helix domain-containing protein [Roseomonas populi]|uniref:helix-turn-helix domain-containing protein n=1 Tax=Roseomonas populi TaxID=3121582 RepID=UPI0038CD3C23